MINYLKNILTSRKFYLSILGGIISIAGILLILNEVIMPAYTNYYEGVTVPDVREISLAEAEELLTSYGLRYEVTDRRANSAFPADYIIDQTPTPAEIVKPNRKIYLTVNTESNPQVTVPNVVDLSYRNARIQLENHGLTPGTVSYESSRFKSSVLRQSVEAGRTVDKGTVVDLVVSDGLGEKMVDMPDIIGLKLTEAQQKLREAGLRIGPFQWKPSKEVSPNTILSFTPRKEQVVEGETITLTISERFKVEEESESGAVSIDTTYIEGDSLQQNQQN
ncbi:PASTA domain-containing protein [Aliifodinibius sp. S!AR15-10]|uniref:PASTA domain-containing protein n=1 Tax=Aliifodinibius sp. S!AR15-10 TaxID=2950437 RepID=UPI0028623C86|nr:PASTA domain-containing protein [Aliifodinibius sp. S!AR15-10]MDR8392159.1 PASTA domain-containing protein [Aliifodinibius sp. S!AR15-10]